MRSPGTVHHYTLKEVIRRMSNAHRDTLCTWTNKTKRERERGGKGIKGREQRQDESEVKQTNP